MFTSLLFSCKIVPLFEVQGYVHVQMTWLLASWCFQPSQPLRIISELKTIFSPSLTYSANKSLNVNNDFLRHSKNISHNVFQQLCPLTLQQHGLYFVAHTNISQKVREQKFSGLTFRKSKYRNPSSK